MQTQIMTAKCNTERISNAIQHVKDKLQTVDVQLPLNGIWHQYLIHSTVHQESIGNLF
jgi:hypothetical protein